MRVLVLCADPGIGLWGRKGASVHLLEVTRALRAEGHEVVLAARRIDGQPPADLADVAVHALPAVGAGDPRRREQRAQAVDAATAQVVADVAPDLLWERYALWSHHGLEAARDMGIPSIIEVNAPLITEQARHRDLVDIEGAVAATQRALQAADVAVAVSEPVARWACAYRHRPVAVVPNGVDPTRFVIADVGGGARLEVVFVGTLKPWHGVEVLLDAMALLHAAPRHDEARSAPRKAVHLHVIGDGPQRESLQGRATDRGIAERVTFHGGVDPAGVPGHLAAADVAVAPYPPGADYFSPLKLLEYQAAGLAIVASAVGQVPLLATHGRDALLVPAGDADALAGALDLLRGDPVTARRLGAEARRRVVATRTWRQVITATLALLPATAHRHGDGSSARGTLRADDVVGA